MKISVQNRNQRANRFSLVLTLAAALCVSSGCATSRPPRDVSRSAAVNQKPAVLPATNAPEGNAAAFAHFAAGVTYELNDNDDRALKEFDEAAASDPSHEPLVLELAQRYLRNHQPDKAVALLNRSADLPSASSPVFSWLARAQLQTGATNAALTSARKAVDKDPQSLDAYESLMEGLLRGGQLTDASRVLARAASSVRREPPSLVGVADLYGGYLRSAPKDNDARERAVSLLDKAAAMQFASPRLWERVATLYARFGETRKAAGIYERLLGESSDSSSEREGLREQLAQIYLEADDKTNALKQLQAIVRDDPTRFPNAWFALGEISEQDEKYSDAVDDFQNAIRAKPELEPAYYDLSLALANLHRTEEAMKILDQARNRFNNGFRFEFYSGLVERQAKDFPGAIRHFTAAETIARATAPALLDKNFYFEIGAACERNRQFTEADQYLQKAVDADPGFAEALNYLGYMLADRGEQLERARSLIERAVKLDPANAAFLDSMGWVLFKSKQPAQALPWMVKAVAASPEPDATILDHLGDVYRDLGQVDKAIDAWKRSLSVEPNDDIKRKLTVNSGS